MHLQPILYLWDLVYHFDKAGRTAALLETEMKNIISDQEYSKIDADNV